MIDNIKIWKCKQTLIKDSKNKINKVAAKWPCVKTTTVLDAPPKTIKNLLMDSSKATLVNKFSSGRMDVLKLGDHSKVVWNRTRMPYSYKPYDFCNLMHWFKVSLGVYI